MFFQGNYWMVWTMCTADSLMIPKLPTSPKLPVLRVVTQADRQGDGLGYLGKMAIIR
jgi:hypothetical protein